MEWLSLTKQDIQLAWQEIVYFVSTQCLPSTCCFYNLGPRRHCYLRWTCFKDVRWSWLVRGCDQWFLGSERGWRVMVVTQVAGRMGLHLWRPSSWSGKGGRCLLTWFDPNQFIEFSPNLVPSHQQILGHHCGGWWWYWFQRLDCPVVPGLISVFSFWNSVVFKISFIL